EGVGEHHLRRRRSAVAAQAVQVAGRVGMLEIDRGGKPAPLHGERADRRFDRPARAEGVAVVALGAADTEPVGVVAEDLLDRRGLRRVVERRRRPVGVDVANLHGCHAGVGEGELHRAGGLAAVGARCASAPPASITSARSSRIAWNASPTAMVPEAQLMALVEFGPVNPNSIAMLQLAAPGNTASASAGSSPRGPSARNRSICDSANATPPSADPIIAPTRSRSSRAGWRSASPTANRALVTASWEKRSRRLARLASRWSCGRKSGISAAIRLLNGAGSKRVISR